MSLVQETSPSLSRFIETDGLNKKSVQHTIEAYRLDLPRFDRSMSAFLRNSPGPTASAVSCAWLAAKVFQLQPHQLDKLLWITLLLDHASRITDSLADEFSTDAVLASHIIAILFSMATTAAAETVGTVPVGFWQGWIQAIRKASDAERTLIELRGILGNGDPNNGSDGDLMMLEVWARGKGALLSIPYLIAAQLYVGEESDREDRLHKALAACDKLIVAIFLLDDLIDWKEDLRIGAYTSITVQLYKYCDGDFSDSNVIKQLFQEDIAVHQLSNATAQLHFAYELLESYLSAEVRNAWGEAIEQPIAEAKAYCETARNQPIAGDPTAQVRETAQSSAEYDDPPVPLWQKETQDPTTLVEEKLSHSSGLYN